MLKRVYMDLDTQLIDRLKQRAQDQKVSMKSILTSLIEKDMENYGKKTASKKGNKKTTGSKK